MFPSPSSSCKVAVARVPGHPARTFCIQSATGRQSVLVPVGSTVLVVEREELYWLVLTCQGDLCWIFKNFLDEVT